MRHWNQPACAVIVCAAITVSTPRLARANGGPIVETSPGASQLGSIVPIQSKHVALVSEDVQLDVLTHYTIARVRYRLRNDGGATTVTFGFPTLVFAGISRSKVSGDFLRYEIRVDGKVVRSRKKLGRSLTRSELKRIAFPNLNKRGGPDLSWRMPERSTPASLLRMRTRRMYQVSKLAFKRRQTRRLEIRFTVPNFLQITQFKYPPMTGISYVSYLTRPARRWKGRISRARFRIRLLGPGGRKLARGSVYPKPHRASKNVLEWSYRNWLPTRTIRVVLPFTVDNNAKRFWKATFKALDKIHGPRVPAGDLRRVWITDVRGQKRRLQRPYTLHRRYGWLLSDQKLGALGRRGGGPTLSFQLSHPACVRAISVLQSDGYRAHQPKTLELRTDSGLRQRIALLPDRAPPNSFSWTGVQVRPLRRPVRVRRLSIRIRSSHATPGNKGWLGVRRLGLVLAPKGACRLRKTR